MNWYYRSNDKCCLCEVSRGVLIVLLMFACAVAVAACTKRTVHTTPAKDVTSAEDKQFRLPPDKNVTWFNQHVTVKADGSSYSFSLDKLKGYSNANRFSVDCHGVGHWDYVNLRLNNKAICDYDKAGMYYLRIKGVYVPDDESAPSKSESSAPGKMGAAK